MVNIFCHGKINGRFGKTKLALCTNHMDVSCRARQHRSHSPHWPHLTLKLNITEVHQNNFTGENNKVLGTKNVHRTGTNH